MSVKNCQHCGQIIWFDHKRGWTHREGGVVMVRCDQCGYKGAPPMPPTTCPSCGVEGLRDDHVATPVMEQAPKEWPKLSAKEAIAELYGDW